MQSSSRKTDFIVHLSTEFRFRPRRRTPRRWWRRSTPAVAPAAMPRLMRASTVLLPCASVEVKVTMVPSGTGLPAQSRIGSVRTRMPFLSGCARHADAARIGRDLLHHAPNRSVSTGGDELRRAFFLGGVQLGVGDAVLGGFGAARRSGRSTVSSNFTGCRLQHQVLVLVEEECRAADDVWACSTEHAKAARETRSSSPEQR